MCAFVLSACEPSAPVVEEAGLACTKETTPIAVIQGDRYSSPLAGETATIRGIVTLVDADSGFYFEEPDSDQSTATSNALYVQDPALSLIAKPGQQLVISGLVSELGKGKNTQTALTQISAHQFCATGLELPQYSVNFELNSREREELESMRVIFTGETRVTDVHNFRRGQLILSSDEVLRVPTEDALPGKAAAKIAKRNRARSISARFDPSFSGPVQVGSRVDGIGGVMGQVGRNQALLVSDPPEVTIEPPAVLEAPKKNSIRVASINLLNFFNGNDQGSRFPAERGAKSLEDFERQSDRIQSALAAMQPGLIAVQELENDGFGAASATQSLLKLLHEAVPSDWLAVETGDDKLGSDFIKVGIFYRADLFEALGPPAISDSPPFRGLSRQPLAQVFRHRETGVQFLVAANHLKSKGSCPESGRNADQDDGQGCWNRARVYAAEAISDWVSDLSLSVPGGHALIMGDMNSYRNEDPIRAFREKGYTELVEHVSGLPQYSHMQGGQAGTLDYIFATPGLVNITRRAQIWHVNSDWPPRTNLPQPWLRFSDHDPVIADLDFSQAATSN